MITLAEIRAAEQRIAPHVRRTPLMTSAPMAEPPTRAELLLKLECLQITGSFKARGAINALAQLAPEALARGVVTASGGNHGLAVAHAARRLGAAAEVFVPATASPEKVARMRRMGAEVTIVGTAFEAARAAADARIAETGASFVHPFADPRVATGQGTVALELLDQEPAPDVVVIAVGGGGLVTGMAVALDALSPGTRIVGVEPVGAPTLHAALAAGRVVEVPVSTRVATLGAGATDPVLLAQVAPLIDEVVLVTDEAMLDAARWLWREMGLATDLSGAAACAALRTGAVRCRRDDRVVALVCGAGSDGLG